MTRRPFLLPPQTYPPARAITRRHAPRDVKTVYAVFRDCLRWEFGFTCAICLLHEVDIATYGEGWGVTQIEHIVPQSHDRSLLGTYTNLLYICRLCNGARSDTDVLDAQGRRLLDPTRDAWGMHFEVRGDTLHPLTSDALYTEEVYSINDARKVRLRLRRRERISSLLSLLARARGRAKEPSVKTQREARIDIRDIRGLLAAYSWIPDDAPRECRCGKKRLLMPHCYSQQDRSTAQQG